MEIITSIKRTLAEFITWFFHLPLLLKIVVVLVLLGFGIFAFIKVEKNSTASVQYQTAKVEKGTIIVSTSTSGQISSANSASITTDTSGVVKKIIATNGQLVKSGDPLVEVDLDQSGKQTYAQALASYQSAQNSLESAKTGLYSLQADLFTQWKKHLDLSTNSTYQNADGSPNQSNRSLAEFHISEDTWLSAEAKYKNQQNVVNQAQTALNASWLSFQKSSPIIYAPISGTMTGMSVQIGSVLAAQSGTTTTSLKIGSIKTDAMPLISVNVTEVDIPHIAIGNKASITLDAFPDKTYTGKVVSVDTVGSISSGVTTYPVVIKLDVEAPEIFSNMSAQANIITQVKDGVIVVPSSAVQNQNGESTVRIMKNGTVQQIPVVAGISSGTQTEIVSGLNVGDTIVTSAITATARSTGTQTRSPFSAIGGAGGGAARFAR